MTLNPQQNEMLKDEIERKNQPRKGIQNKIK